MTLNKVNDPSRVHSDKPASTSVTSVPQPYSIFDSRQKALTVFLVSTAATFSGFASNIYFPALPTIAHDLSVSTELVNLSVTSYLIFQGLAPSLWGPISDVKGRRVAYICTFLVFVGASVGLALTKNYATLIVLRCLQSTGSASTIAIGSGVIGDITTRAERGGYMGIFQAGLLVPVAVGPVMGGALAGSLGWRAIFWFLTIYGSVFLAFLILLLPETLRSIVANGSQVPENFILKFPLYIYQKSTRVEHKPESSSSLSTPAARKPIDLTGPFRILISKQAAPPIVFLAIYYAVWQMSITAMSTLFKENYNLSTIHLGLTYLANGLGSIIGTLTTGKILDMDYRRHHGRLQAKPHDATTITTTTPSSSSTSPTLSTSNHDPRSLEESQDPYIDEDEESSPSTTPRLRLRLLPLYSTIQCLSIPLFGWTVQYPDHIPVAVPIISTFVTGWTAVSIQSITMTYLVDLFQTSRRSESASASAALNLCRCLFAAGGTSLVEPLVRVLGSSWTFLICAAVQALVALGWYFGGGGGGIRGGSGGCQTQAPDALGVRPKKTGIQGAIPEFRA